MLAQSPMSNVSTTQHFFQEGCMQAYFNFYFREKKMFYQNTNKISKSLEYISVAK